MKFMLLKKRVILFSLVLLSLGARSQSCDLTLKGSVLDADNHENLEFAIIHLEPSEKTLQTNDKGEFVFEGLCPGTYKIKVQHLGCKDSVFSVELQKSRKIILKLPHSLHNLEEIDVMDKRVEMKKTQAQNELSNEEIQKTKGQSLGEVLKQIPGVTSLNTGATISKPMVHGMQGYRILILNNGIRQEGQQWGNEHAPEIDPFMAKRFSVIKGVGAIRYGSDAIAGVVLVEPDELPDTAAVTGEVNLAGLSNGRSGAASGILQGSFEKLKGFSWRVQGTLKKGGTLKTPNYYLSNTALEEKNFSYALAYHHKKWGAEIYYSQFNTKIGIYKGSSIGNLTDLQNAFAMKKPIDSGAVFSYEIDRPNQDVTHELIKTVAHYHFSPKWRSKLQYAWQYNSRKEYDLRRLTTAEKESGVIAPDMDLNITSQTLDAIVEHDNIKSFRGSYGLSVMLQENVYAGRFFIPNYINNTWGAFATERYVLPHLELEAGIRYDEKNLQSYFYEGSTWANHNRSFNNFTYNMGLIWKPLSNLNVLLNAGSAWRSPSPNELYSDGIHQGAAAIERGDKDLISETVQNITGTLIYKNERITTELTAYHNKFNNFIYLNPTGKTELTIRGAFPVFEYKQDNVRISGLDFKSDFELTHFLNVIVKGILVRGWNYSLNDHLIYMPSDRIELAVRLGLPETAKFKGSYVQINNMHVAKQWRVPAASDFAPPPESYYLIGIDFGTEVQFKKQKVIFNFGATNLFNTVYREYLDRFRYYCDATGVSYNVRITVPFILINKTNKQ
jgi:iron complex outermembrane receptor protein